MKFQVLSNRSDPNGVSICIGIPTCGRPDGLTKLLHSLNAMIRTPNIKVVVIDNQGGQDCARSIVKQLRDGFHFDLYIEAEERKGISFARNRILQIAFEEYKSDYLAMIDDDEVVDKNWIYELVSCALRFDADVVTGKIVPSFQGIVSDEIKNLKIYQRDKFGEEGLIKGFDNTGAMLLARLAWFRAGSPYFDTNFKRGEDTEFLYRLKRRDLRFAFSNRAVSYESYTDERVTNSWIKSRTILYGNVQMKILIKHRRALILLAQCFYALALIIILSPLKLLLRERPVACNQISLKLYRQVGKIQGILRRPINY